MQEIHKHIKVFTDGGARGNPGPAAAGVVVENIDGTLLTKESKYLGEITNNQAEYLALKLGLETAMQYQPEQVEVFMDSELVVNQMKGQYRVKNTDLKSLHAEIQTMIAGKQVSFTHIRRELNQLADKLVNQELDRRS